MNTKSRGAGSCGKSSLINNTKPTQIRKKSPMTPQGQTRSYASSKIPGGNDKLRQKRRFPTDYCGLIKRVSSNPPASLLRGIATTEENAFRKKENPGLGKVKIMLRVSSDCSMGQPGKGEFLRVEENKKHVSVFVPHEESKRNPALAPKVYAFDSVFTEASSQAEICNTSLPDVIQAVLQGADGTVFCYGQSNLGKTHVLLGHDRSTEDVGVLPCAINWLYRCINELKEQQGTRFSIRVSAIEVYGRSEKLRDLLAGYCEDGPSGTLCVVEDPLMGTQLQNQCEIRANSAERSAYLLDAAIASRSCSGSRNTAEARRHSHMVFTLHVYHHKIGDNGVSGGRSRLHFIDLGSCERTLVKTTSSLALSLSSLGHVIMAIVNNSKHVPFKESKLTCVLREMLGNVNCRVAMLAHVSRDVAHYSDTLSTIQMASRIHRVLKKKYNSNHCHRREHNIQRSQLLRSKCRDDDSVGSSSGMEYTSGSELSCDTVVYVNKKGLPMSDRELTDNEGPPESLPIRAKAKIPPIIAEASPPEDCGMVYNIAQAKVHKLAKISTAQTKPKHKEEAKVNENLKRPTPSNSMPVESFGLGDRKHKPPRYLITNETVSEKEILSHGGSSTNGLSHGTKQSFGYKPPSTSRGVDMKKNSLHKSFHNNADVVSSCNDITKPSNVQKLRHTRLPSREKGIPLKPPRSKNTLQEKSSLPERKRSSLPRPCKLKNALTSSIDDCGSKEININKKPTKTCDTNKTQDLTSLEANRFNHIYENISLKSQPTSSLQDDGKIYSDLTQNSNSCIPNVQQFTEDIKSNGNIAYTSDYTQYNSLSKTKNIYPTAQDERPEPVGCASDSEPVFASKPTPEKSNNKKVEIRPDSLLVNLDEEDWTRNGKEDFSTHSDDDAVDVNFYCLTFMTKNPLLPMSKSKFSQQIKNNLKKKSFSETSSTSETQQEGIDLVSVDTQVTDITNSIHNDPPLNIKSLHDASGSDSRLSPSVSLTRSDTFIVDVEESEKAMWTREVRNNEMVEVSNEDSIDGVKDLSEEEIDFGMPNIKEMPKLQCVYGSDTNRSYSGNVTKRSNSRNVGTCHNFPQHEVRVYDSNSLEMSYVSTKQTCSSSSFDSPSKSSATSQSPSRREVNKSSEVQRRTTRPVVMTKSVSKEGARLTLVKKRNNGGPTLELLITNENDKNKNNELQTSKSSVRSRIYGTSADSLSKQSNESCTDGKKSPLNSGTTSKKSKWSGLKRFGSKKSDAKPKKHKNTSVDPKNSNHASMTVGSKSNTENKEVGKCAIENKNRLGDTITSLQEVSKDTLSKTKVKHSKSLSQPRTRPPGIHRRTTSQTQPSKSGTSSPLKFGFSRKSKLK